MIGTMAQPNQQYDFSKLDDLKVQAMLFDMEVDLEAFDLVAKRKDDRPGWQIRWNDKRNQGDFDEYTDIDQE